MRKFTIMVDELKNSARPDLPPTYMIALAPSNRSSGAMATKQYASQENFVLDLHLRLRYTRGAVERFFASDDRHQVLLNYPLSEEDAFYLGWLPEFNVE